MDGKVATSKQAVKITSRKHRDGFVPFLFILPFIVSFLIFFIFPAVYSFILSFCSFKGYGKAKFIGFDNYIALLNYPVFWVAVKNTFFYFIVHTIPVMILAFMLAVAIHSKLLGRSAKIYKPVLFLPQIMAVVASALVWRIILGTRTGVVNQILGTQIPFIEDVSYMKWSVILLLIWRATGWYMVIYLAGLTTISDEIIEAATIDGANIRQRLWYITLPMMKPIFMFAFLMNAIGSLKIFTEPNILMSAGTTCPPDAAPIMNILTNNINGGNFGMASAVGWVIFIIILIISMVQYRLFREGAE